MPTSTFRKTLVLNTAAMQKLQHTQKEKGKECPQNQSRLEEGKQAIAKFSPKSKS